MLKALDDFTEGETEEARLEGMAQTFARARAGDVEHSLADIGKARQLLGYDPQVDVREGLARTLEWYRSAGARR